MKVLITGRGVSGSWKIRGEQLGRELGAKVNASIVETFGSDVVVHVKRGPYLLRNVCRDKKVPFVWDVVDSWPQPIGNTWDKKHAIAWLKSELSGIRPDAVIGATQQMALDVQELGYRAICIPHHYKDQQPKNPIREELRTVGYVGSNSYISNWRLDIDSVCSELGLKFNSDVIHLADIDVVLALRDYDGYPARFWKSNVKLANAQYTGTPFIGSPEAGYLETSSGAERFVKDKKELKDALIELKPQSTRIEIHNKMLSSAHKVSVEAVSKQYKEFLELIHDSRS